MVETKKTISNAFFDRIHILFWLCKDSSWLLGFKFLGTILIIPTIGVSLAMVWLNRNDRLPFLIELAVLCWICANSIWMIDEFYELGIKFISIYLFLSGIGIILYSYFDTKRKNSIKQ